MDQKKEIREEIRREIELLFAAAPKTRASWELQEELLANCMERYEDLTGDGMESHEAVRAVVGSIGNVDELIASLPEEDGVVGFAWDAQRRRSSALTVTIAVGLYILAVVVFFVGMALTTLFGAIAYLIGIICAVVVCIIPTCMLVYNAYRYPKYQRKKDTVVENFKQWNSDSTKVKQVRGALSSMLWTLTVLVYMLLSFSTGAWYITWVIFLVAACLESAIILFFKLKELPK